MRAQGLEASIAGVAHAYHDFLDALIADDSDSEAARRLEAKNLTVHCTNVLMRSSEDKARIARTALAVACPTIMAESATEVK